MIYLHWTFALTLFLEQFHVKHSLEIKGQRYYCRKFQPRWVTFAKVLMHNRKKSGLERKSGNDQGDGTEYMLREKLL